MSKGKYYLHLPKWPSFTWTDPEKGRLPTWFKEEWEKVDGDVPATRLTSWQDFHRLANHERFASDEFIFRGQHNYTWDLVPSLARNSTGGVYEPPQAKECLESFRRSSRGRKEFDPNLDSDLEMWALGQHYGLRTPLLDWTLSPYVALFFAFEKDDESSSSGNHSRAIFALNKTKIEERVRELLEEGWRDDQVVHIFQPSGDTNRRLLSQAGLFLAVPPRESVTSWILTNLGTDRDSPERLADIIMKVHIANEGRDECLRMLRRMNIHHANLFPDLAGSSAYSNFELSVYRNNNSGHTPPVAGT
jgi:hypothetical protein